MKHGWHGTINDAVFHHGTPFNVAVIRDQLSSYNNMLRGMTSEGKMFDVRLSATSQEHTPRDKSKVNENGKAIEENKEENWIAPKHAPIEYFCMKHKNAEEKKESRNDDRCKLLQCDEDDDMNEEEKESESFKVEKAITRKDVKLIKENRMKQITWNCMCSN